MLLPNACEKSMMSMMAMMSRLAIARQTVHSRISLKSMIVSTIARGRVLIRLLINGKTGNCIDATHALPAQTAERLFPVHGLTNRLINGLLNGERVLINRIIMKWSRESMAKQKHLIRDSVLSLGLVGVCVKRDSPSLMTESDELESKCQQIRSVFSYYKDLEFVTNKVDSKTISLSNIEFGSCIAKGCNGVVYDVKLKDNQTNSDKIAVKMMFNYEAESNAAAIWRAMHKECLPFCGDFSPQDINGLIELKKRPKLRSHPNIVEIYGVFADAMPTLKDSFKLYPDALPPRLGGYARNMTLFIVEKRYDMSLKQFLYENRATKTESLAMLTQLLEAVSYLVKSQIAHRDLKTDNVLVDLHSYDMPWLVITDFGFSLTNLSLSFTSDEVCRGGNRALMAPEVICTKAGSFAKIDYTYSDLWSVGAIAYELYGDFNPFYPYPDKHSYLQSCSYNDSDLPEMPNSMPNPIQTLVKGILRRNPNKRPSALTATTICQIVMNMTDTLMQKMLSYNSGEREKQLYHWLKTLSITTLSKRKNLLNEDLLTDVEFKLRILLLSKVKITSLNDAFNYLSNC